MRRALVSVILATTLYCGTAHADGWDAAMARGAAAKEKALDSEDPLAWQEVLDLFLEADAVRATKESKYEIGFAASKTKATDLAVEAYEDAIELGLTGPAAERAKAYVADHATSLARLDVRGPKGARVSINGRRRAVFPLKRPIVVFAGALQVRVTSGAETFEQTVNVAVGETKTLDLSPPPPPPPTAARPVAPAPSPHSNVLGWTLVGTGAFIGVASSTLWIIAAQTVSTRRDSLSYVCEEYRLDDPDLCMNAKRAEWRDFAQQDSDMIRTFRPLRIVGAIGLGVGLVVAGLGVYRLSVMPDVSHDRAALTLRFAF